MEVISIYLIVLTIISVFVYYHLKLRAKVLLLNLISCGFLASISPNLLAYVFLFTIVNFIIGLNLPGAKNKKALFRTGILINLVQLIILNYADFTLDPILDLFHSNYKISLLSKIITPVGISYYTLQGIGYLVNVKMGWEKPERNFLHFFLYINFYPKFLSGPIERSNHFLPQLKEMNFNEVNVISGLKLILLGFFKKLIIANHLAPFIDFAYSSTETIGSNYSWLIILIQPLYLYFDFSGYTDIARGYAKMYGFDLLPNFNRPFLAENITNFWKRFHISLSSWFNDYVFNQISFRLRKKKQFGAIIALFVTWILFGIWHGAGWNFMILGFVFSIEIIYEYFTRKQRYKFFSRLPNPVRKWSGRIFTYMFYGWALTFFFSPELPSTLRLFGNLFTGSPSENSYVYMNILLFGIAVALAYLVWEVVQNDFTSLYERLSRVWHGYKILRIAVYYIVAIILVSEIRSNSTFVYQMF